MSITTRHGYNQNKIMGVIPFQESTIQAINEQYDMAFRKIIDNIYDPNTDAIAKRKLVIETTFAPDEDREIAKTTISVKITLAKTKSIETKLAIDYDPDLKQAVAAEWGSAMKGQISIDDEDLPENVSKFKKI